MQKKTKICYVITLPGWGGAQKYVFDLAANLNKNQYEVIVATGGTRNINGTENMEHKRNFNNYTLINKLQEAGIATHRFKHFVRDINIYHDILAIFEMFFYFKKNKFNIVHLNSSKAGFIGSIAAKLAGAKVIYTAHGFVFNEPLGFLKKKFYLYLEKWSSVFKDKIIAVSEFDRQVGLKAKVAGEKQIITIHNGIDFDKLSFLPRDEARRFITRNMHGTETRGTYAEPSTQVIGTVAGLFKTKGLDIFIEAATLVHRSLSEGGEHNRNNIIFIVLTFGGPEEKNLQNKIKELKLENKFFIIKVEGNNAAQYLRGLDLFVLSSVKEGLPYLIMETMYAGVPFIAHRVGGVNDFEILPEHSILPASQTPQESPGIVIPAQAGIQKITNKKTIPSTGKQQFTAENLASKIQEFLDEKLPAHNYQDYVKQEFSLEKMIAETQKIYQITK